MEELIQLIKDISFPAAIVLSLIILNKSGLLALLVDLLRSKINGNTNLTIGEKLSHIEKNHLHEILEILKRIESGLSKDHQRFEDKMEKLLNEMTYIKARINGK